MSFVRKFFSKDMNKAFVRSFEKGFYQKALRYAQKGANPNAKNYEGNTFLHYYVSSYVYLSPKELKVYRLPEEPDENVLAQMKELGANMDCLNRQKQTPLEIALINDNPVMVSALIRAGADKEHRDKNGLTPLQNAVYHGQGRNVRILLRMGADIEAALHNADSLMNLMEKGQTLFEKYKEADFNRVKLILNELKKKGFNVDQTPHPKEITELAVVETMPDLRIIQKLQNQHIHS